MELPPKNDTLLDLALKEEYITLAETEAAVSLALEVNNSFGSLLPIITNNPEKFGKIYNPALPTVAFDLNYFFGGGELVAIANSRRQDPHINVVFFSMPTAELQVATHGENNQLWASRVHVISGRGQVISQALDEPIPIIAVETGDPELLGYLNEQNIRTLSSISEFTHYNTKRTVPNQAKTAGILRPKRMALHTLHEKSDAVIKPSGGMRGSGVYFTSSHSGGPTAWKSYYDYLDTKGYEPVIEERIKQWPLREPQTGEQLDWNARIITSYTKPVAMYIRAGTPGSAINLNTGARAVALSKLASYLKYDGNVSAKIVQQTLLNAACDFAEVHPVFLNGLDLSINDRGQVVMFESNVAYAGGLQTIAAAIKSQSQKLTIVEPLLTQLEDRLHEIVSNGSIDTTQPLRTSLGAKINFALSTNNRKLLSHEISTKSYSLHTPRHSLVAAAVCSVVNPTTLVDNPEIERLIHEHPLELPYLLHNLGTSMLGSSALRACVEEYLEIDPESVEWQLLRGFIGARTGDIALYRSAYELASKQGKLDDRDRMLWHLTWYLLKDIPNFKNDGETQSDGIAWATYRAVKLFSEHTEFSTKDETETASSNTEDATEDKQLAIACANIHLSILEKDYAIAETLLDGLPKSDQTIKYLKNILKKNYSSLHTTPRGIALYIKCSRLRKRILDIPNKN